MKQGHESLKQRPQTEMKVLARIAFSWKVGDTDYPDPGSAGEEMMP
jgi:hypothetical protein